MLVLPFLLPFYCLLIFPMLCQSGFLSQAPTSISTAEEDTEICVIVRSNGAANFFADCEPEPEMR